jgi:hypothetical protein
MNGTLIVMVLAVAGALALVGVWALCRIAALADRMEQAPPAREAVGEAHAEHRLAA